MNLGRRVGRGALGALALAMGLSTGCGAPAPLVVSDAAMPPPPRPALDELARARFNVLAVERHLPLFWDADADGDRVLDPDELVVVWQGVEPTRRADWAAKDGFTERFYASYSALVAYAKSLEAPEVLGGAVDRTALLRRELGQGRPSVVRSRFLGASAEARAIVEHVVNAARLVEELHAEQQGTLAMRARIAETDTLGQSVFYRNQGPWCVAPATESDPKCNALGEGEKKLVGVYPASLQAREGFCDGLKAMPNAEALRHQFTVVREAPEGLVAVPYHLAYASKMEAVSRELAAAAIAITSPEEAAFKSYLVAASKAFTDGSWEAADEAWAKMSVHNSKWYLRIGPDEVYWEPCSLKAGFHVSFAQINQDSLKWQKLLDPVKGDMEKALAALAGPPYVAREVSFHLPDFIDIVLNAGDSRDAHGATIGQSLPNWGPVANEGRGRTVTMTNLYTDADSRADLEKLAASALCAESFASFTSAPEPQIMGTVLHEAAHNLGPAHEYAVGGKKDREVFGGPLASMLEELKAQTAALYFTDWLGARKLLDDKTVVETHVRDVVWAFGHISRGMYAADKQPRPYSQLAAIQVGVLAKEGALEWRAAEKAANGADLGCFVVHTTEFPTVVEGLMRDVGGIKARGDKAAAAQLVAAYVDAGGAEEARRTLIRERWLRAPKASFLYAIER